MINKTSTDKEILDYVLPGSNITVRDFPSLSFMSFIANKLDGLPTYKAATQELLGLVRSAPLGRMPDDEKVRILRKLFELDIQV